MLFRSFYSQNKQEKLQAQQTQLCFYTPPPATTGAYRGRRRWRGRWRWARRPRPRTPSGRWRRGKEHAPGDSWPRRCGRPLGSRSRRRRCSKRSPKGTWPTQRRGTPEGPAHIPPPVSGRAGGREEPLLPEGRKLPAATALPRLYGAARHSAPPQAQAALSRSSSRPGLSHCFPSGENVTSLWQ